MEAVSRKLEDSEMIRDSRLGIRDSRFDPIGYLDEFDHPPVEAVLKCLEFPGEHRSMNMDVLASKENNRWHWFLNGPIMVTGVAPAKASAAMTKGDLAGDLTTKRMPRMPVGLMPG